jgi:hypothetical protein
MLGVSLPAVAFFCQFLMLSIYCPFGTRNWLHSAERVEAGETGDSSNKQ